jgi:hypothetical protein
MDSLASTMTPGTTMGTQGAQFQRFIMALKKHMCRCENPSILRPLASPQTHRLAKLLQLGQQLITLLHNLVVLSVLVVWPVGLDSTVDTVNGAVQLL